MSYDVNCAACQAVQGACVDCGGCFRKHCQCDPCQHGKARADINSCVFCRPTIGMDYVQGPEIFERHAETLGGPGPEDKDEQEPPEGDDDAVE